LSACKVVGRVSRGERHVMIVIQTHERVVRRLVENQDADVEQGLHGPVHLFHCVAPAVSFASFRTDGHVGRSGDRASPRCDAEGMRWSRSLRCRPRSYDKHCAWPRPFLLMLHDIPSVKTNRRRHDVDVVFPSGACARTLRRLDAPGVGQEPEREESSESKPRQFQPA